MQLIFIFLCAQLQTSTFKQISRYMADNILGKGAQLLKTLKSFDTIGLGFVIGQS